MTKNIININEFVKITPDLLHKAEDSKTHSKKHKNTVLTTLLLSQVAKTVAAKTDQADNKVGSIPALAPSAQAGANQGTGGAQFPPTDGLSKHLEKILQEIKDGTLKGVALIKALQEVIQDVNMNSNSVGSIVVLAKILAAVGNKWKSFNGNTQKAISAMLKKLEEMKIKDSNGNTVSFAQYLADTLRSIAWFGGRTKQKARAFIQKLLDGMSGISGVPLVSQLKQQLEKINTNAAWKAYFDKYSNKKGQPIWDRQDAYWAIGGNGSSKYGIIGNYTFFEGVTKQGGMHTFFMTYVDQLIKTILAKYKNGSEVIMILIALIFGKMDSQQMKIGSYGNLTKDLKHASDLINEIMKIWNKNEQINDKGQVDWTKKDLIKMMKDIHELLNQLNLQSGRFGNIGKSISSFFGALLNQKIDNDPGNPKSGQSTFDKLFMKWQKDGFKKDKYKKALVTALYNWAPNPKKPSKDLTIYNNIVNGMKSSTTKVNDQNSLVNQEVQQITSNLQSETGTSKGILDKWIAWTQHIVDAYGKANA